MVLGSLVRLYSSLIFSKFLRALVRFCSISLTSQRFSVVSSFVVLISLIFSTFLATLIRLYSISILKSYSPSLVRLFSYCISLIILLNVSPFAILFLQY